MDLIVPGSSKSRIRDLQEKIAGYIRKGSSASFITWDILGGKTFMSKEPVSTLDFLAVSNSGITMQSAINLASILDIPMKDMADLLNVSYKTISRKKNTDLLDELSSSLIIEIAGTIATGLALFEDAEKLRRWLKKENKALMGKKPIELLNTPTGIKLVNNILHRIEEGIYT